VVFAVLFSVALWEARGVARPPVPLVPQRLSRLALPVYGSEHLLLFRARGTEEEEERVLPVLLRFREGEQLERLADDATVPASPAAAVGVECAARSKLFQAASRARLAPWDLLNLGDGSPSFFDALLRFLTRNGWKPVAALLGAASAGKARYREDVGYRDMGMNTEAAPSSVRVGELASMLQCVGDDGGTELSLALEGPGEAVLLACAGGLPLEATADTWEQRSVPCDRLPEVQPGRCRDLRTVFERTVDCVAEDAPTA